MKNLTRFFALLLALCLLTACGDTHSDATGSSAASPVTGMIVKGNGCNVQGLQTTLAQFGYKAEASSTPRGTTPPFLSATETS